jgi:hypothetical protein
MSPTLVLNHPIYGSRAEAVTRRRRGWRIGVALSWATATLFPTTALAQTSPTSSVSADLNQYLDEIKIERVTSAMRSAFADFIGQDIEILLAEKAGVTPQEFRRQLAASAEDLDPLIRARALVLRGEFTNALKLTATLKLKAAAEMDLRSVLTVEAQARAGIGDHEGALGARQQIAGFDDKTKDPAAWAVAQQMVAYAFESLGRESEAESTLHEILAVLQKVPGPEHLDTLTSRLNLGNALYLQGRRPEAYQEYAAVYDVRHRILGADHPETLESRAVVAGGLHWLGRSEEMEREYQAILAAQKRVLGGDHPEALGTRNAFASSLLESKMWSKAAAEFKNLLAALKRLKGAAPVNIRAVHHSLARALECEADENAADENPKKARQLYTEALIHLKAADLPAEFENTIKNKLAVLPAAD